MYYRLVSVIDTPYRVRVCFTKNGYAQYGGSMVLEPGKTYTTDGDERLENSLREFEIKKAYNSSLEEMLKANNIPYRVAVCGACGGKKKNLFYKPVEVFE